MKKLAEDLQETVLTKLAVRAEFITVAYDGYTNVNHHKVYNILLLTDGQAYYFNSINMRHSSDTDESIQLFLSQNIEVLKRRGLNIVGIVCDNAANVTAAGKVVAEKYGLVHVGCAAHQLQLITNTFLNYKLVNDELHVFTGIVNEFQGNKRLRHLLDKRTKYRILKENTTRWNGRYYA